MALTFMQYLFGLCLFGVVVPGNSLKCFEYACNGTNCLSTEVINNPLLIKKCERVIYKGCYTVTTTFNEFSLTTAGCVDKHFVCATGTCSGSFVRTTVSCCNSDLCNDGIVESHSYRPVINGICFMLCVFMNRFCFKY